MKEGAIIDLKIRYLNMLQDEGCLNEIVFNNPEWDDVKGHDIADYGIKYLIDRIPDDVILRQWEYECLYEEDFAV